MNLPLATIGERTFVEVFNTPSTSGDAFWSTARITRPSILRAFSFVCEAELPTARTVIITLWSKDVLAPTAADFIGGGRILPSHVGQGPADRWTATHQTGFGWIECNLRISPLPTRLICRIQAGLTNAIAVTSRLIIDTVTPEES